MQLTQNELEDVNEKVAKKTIPVPVPSGAHIYKTRDDSTLERF